LRPVKCTNEHFFDADKFSTCPQCGAGIKMSNSSLFAKYEEKAPKHSLFKKNKKEPVKIPLGSEQGTVGFFTPNSEEYSQPQYSDAPAQNVPSYPQAAPQMQSRPEYQPPVQPAYQPAYQQPPVFQQPPVQRQPMQSPMTPASPVQSGYAQPVTPWMQPAPAAEPDPAEDQLGQVPFFLDNTVEIEKAISSSPKKPAAEQPAEPSKEQDVMIEVEVPDGPEPEQSSATVSSVADELKKVSSDYGGMTVGFFSAPKKNQERTASEFRTNTDPVVGWLICLRGEHFGESFNVYSGRNSIGRSHSNRICISRDVSVSREKHAWIVYDPRKRSFLLQPGEVRGLVYLNGNILTKPAEIRGDERIEIGNTILKLVPLCGEYFSWEMVNPDGE